MTALPPWFPQSGTEIWAQWLGWRLPHYDAMQRDAAGHLTGTRYAVIRAGWDGDARREADYHATLFTLTSETQDAAAARAATTAHKPAGVVLHHVVTDTVDPEAAK